MRLHSICAIFVLYQQIYLTTAIVCPDGCRCSWILDSLKVDCSNGGLTSTPIFGDLPIEFLDLSNNNFDHFPTELSLIPSLTSLDLSNNLIQFLPADSFLGFVNLKHLLLGNNNIKNWRDINPNELLLGATSLETLSLSGNALGVFAGNDEMLILYSHSLITLDISYCQISKFSGDFVLQGLTKLENLVMNGNPIRTPFKIVSPTLKTLELSNCNLRVLHPAALNGLPELLSIDLSKNILLNLVPEYGEFPQSKPLRRLNLSFCNMPMVDLKGFPNITTALLKGNMIREITETSFARNDHIEILDLSHNAIGVLGITAFSKLRNLKQLDLSYNMIATIDRNTFAYNEILTNLNLSRNIITRLSRISGTSITTLDLSACEISIIDPDALIDMPVTDLDLSNNLISDLPNQMTSQTLQILDLSMCRLSSIRNGTFRGLPELSRINLSGNRLTTPFQTDFFRENKFLHEILLEDNPWRCDCNDKSFRQFYLYLIQSPQKASSRRLKCSSPENAFGRTWDSYCSTVWFPRHSTAAMEKFWTVTMTLLIIVSICIITYKLTTKFLKKRKDRQNRSELQANLEDQRRVQQYNRNIMQEDAARNAPDPRESNPPSYEDALLMPRLKRLTKSFADITSSTKQASENEYESVPTHSTRRNQYHSDNALLQGDEERTANIRRTPSFRRQSPRTRRNSRLVAVRPPKCPDQKLKVSDSVGKMSNFRSFENSPYTRRKPKSTTTDDSISRSSSKSDIPGDVASSLPVNGGAINFVEDYYIRPRSLSGSGEEYELVSSTDEYDGERSSICSSQSEQIVIVHHEPRESQL